METVAYAAIDYPSGRCILFRAMTEKILAFLIMSAMLGIYFFELCLPLSVLDSGKPIGERLGNLFNCLFAAMLAFGIVRVCFLLD